MVSWDGGGLGVSALYSWVEICFDEDEEDGEGESIEIGRGGE